MRRTTEVGVEKVEDNLLSGGFMMNLGPWDEKKENGHCLAQSVEDAGARKKHQIQSTRVNIPQDRTFKAISLRAMTMVTEG